MHMRRLPGGTIIQTLTAAGLFMTSLLMGTNEALGSDDKAVTENKELARNFIEEVYNRRNIDKIDDYIAEDFVDSSPGRGADARGIAFVKEQARQTFETIPDIEFSVLDIVGEGDKLAIYWKAAGGFRGPAANPLPAPRQVEVQGISIFQYRNGLVVESWDIVDRLGMLLQAGFELSPPPTETEKK